MKIIHLSDYSDLSHCKDLITKNHNTTFDNSNIQEYEIAKNKGQGGIKMVVYGNGVRYICYKATFFEDISLKFTNTDSVLRFYYFLNGELNLKTDDPSEEIKLEKYMKLCANCNSDSTVNLILNKNQEAYVAMVEISRERFPEEFAKDLPPFKHIFDSFISKKFVEDSKIASGHFNLSIHKILKETTNWPGDKALEFMYIKGKLYELLSYEFDFFNDYLEQRIALQEISARDIQLVDRAVEFIKSNLHHKLTTSQIAEYLNTNVNRVQKSFKGVLQTTINDFKKDVRLNEVQRLLIETDLSISEISDVVGISSKSYLSKTFKEKYQTCPKLYRQKHKNLH
ncbi:helix-turn-helix transcriptional regulator [Galbibacter sp. BG1]|uniref:helix-turn-helix domain-containing protein n=1 Tax=Galbibacter sp. BG1 TaxID=1170699 RepID=UPI0015BA3744|nr:helix-turn-helix domain-containing protein [Galbibacter sp. BG1]QLE02840.1 helix-turn-helix transcriptional regulator [Galbibacter sp. BG1]